MIDNGSPPLSSVTRVVVNVDDVNDCAPEFFKDRFRAQIPKQNDFDLYRITAFDRDAGNNADISYSIVDDEDGDGSVPTFTINSTTGVLSSMTELDVDENYKLQVSCRSLNQVLRCSSMFVRKSMGSLEIYGQPGNLWAAWKSMGSLEIYGQPGNLWAAWSCLLEFVHQFRIEV